MNVLGDSSDSVSFERPTESFLTDTDSEASAAGIFAQFMKRFCGGNKLGVRKEFRLAEGTTATLGGDYTLQSVCVTPVAKIVHEVNENGRLQMSWRKLKYSQRFGIPFQGRRFSIIPSASVRYDDGLSCSIALKIPNVNLKILCGTCLYFSGFTINKRMSINILPQTETTSGMDLVGKMKLRRNGPVWKPNFAMRDAGVIFKLGPERPPLWTDTFSKLSSQNPNDSRNAESPSESDDAEERVK